MSRPTLIGRGVGGERADRQRGWQRASRCRSRGALARIAGWVAVGVLVAGGVALAGGHGTTRTAQPVAAAGSSTAAAPDLAGSDPITGRRVSVARFAGRPAVVNVWASWCPGCNQEARDLRRFALAHPGVPVLGIDMQDTTGGARAFYRKWRWQHPSISDPDGTLAARLAVTGLPTTLFLDARHQVVARIVGASSLAGFDRGLRILQTRGGR